MNKIIIFDYDDTLAYNMIDYYLANLKFLEYVIQKIGPIAPNLDEILRIEAEIDDAAIKKDGFKIQRFPTSVKETYRSICEQLKIPVKEEDLQTAYNIGMTAFDENAWKQRGLVEGANEVLDFLSAQKDELMLLTKGDCEVQSKKLRATDCKRWFGDRMYISQTKNKDDMLHVVQNRDKSKVWYVGNSQISDVVPALEAEIGAIYIPLERWGYEKKHKKFIEHPRLIVFDKILEIKNQYERIK